MTARFCLCCREFELVERQLDAACARCAGRACAHCDLCHGCQRVLCGACNEAGVSPYGYLGDVYWHPHNTIGAEAP